LSAKNEELIRLQQEKEKLISLKSVRPLNITEKSEAKSNYFTIRPSFLTKATSPKIDRNSNTEKTMQKISITSEDSILSDTRAKFVSPKINFQFIQCKEVASLSPLTSQKEITTTTTAATATTDDPDAINNIYLMFDKKTAAVTAENEEPEQKKINKNQKNLSNHFFNKSFRENLENSATRSVLPSSKYF
jgi:hypothetical protein